MGTKEYWVNELEKFSRKVLLNPSDQNRKDLRDWFKRRISFEDDVSEIECIREIDARPSSVGIMISLSMIGAKEFSGYLWSRQIDNRNKLQRLESDNNRLTFESIDRYVAFNILDRHSLTEIQILKILSYLPTSEKRDFETLIKNEEFKTFLVEMNGLISEPNTAKTETELANLKRNTDYLIFITLFSQKMFYLTHRCLCQMLILGHVKPEMMELLKQRTLKLFQISDKPK